MRPLASPSVMLAWTGILSLVGSTTPAAPASPVELADRAIGQLRERDWEGAAKTYREIVRANPYRADHWHNYGYSLHRSGRYEEAIGAWKEAAELGFAWDPLWERGLVWDPTWVKAFGPGTPVPWYNIARAEARLGRKDEALRSLRRALEEGFAVEESLRDEADLAPLRDDPRFRSLVGSHPPEGLSRVGRWRFDLDYLARRMEQVHHDLYRKVSRAQFRGAIETLKDRIPQQDDHEVVVEIQRILAMARSGHTRLHWPDDGPYALSRYPVEFYLYKDGLFVRRAARRLSEAVGGRVLRIGERTAEEALKAVEPLCSVDGPMGIKAEAPSLLARPQVLHALGLAADMDRVPLVVERGGRGQVRVDLDLGKHPGDDPADWIMINADTKAALPLSLKMKDPFYWFEHLPESGLVYFQYNAVANKKEESLAQFCRRMMAFIEANRVEYLAIDLRRNGGGDSLLNRALIRELIRSDKINRRGHLYVIIGRRTFSAAMNAASDLERQTEALFVGEPTCSSPNCVGQATPLTLPCSGLRLGCASLYFQGATLSADRRPWIAPDIAAEATAADEAANRDPALMAILAEIRPARPAGDAGMRIPKQPPPAFARSAREQDLPGFDPFIAEAIDAWEVPGLAIAIVKDGELVFSEGFGKRDVGEDLPVTPGTLFAIGSATKALRHLEPGYDPSTRRETAKLAFDSSPAASVDGWRSPVLVIHEDDDRNVPFGETVRLVEDLRARGVDVEQLVFPDEVHSFLTYERRIQCHRAAADFLIRRL